MEDMKNQYPLNGNWGHPPHHTRPFFCVPQPTQPYFTTYPWNMNPYSQYSFPWPAMPYGRYMTPVQYMQQSYIVPQAPLYPADYRRIFNQQYSFPSAQDVNFLQPVEQFPLQRDTACSEAQTEPYDAVSKICEKPAEDMASNCAVISSTPATVQYPGKEEVPSGSDRPGVGATLPQKTCSNSQNPGDSAIQQSSLNESSQGCLEECVLSDVMPLDGSSVNDVCLNEKGTESDQQDRLCSTAGPDDHGMEDIASTPHPDSGVHECGPLTQSLESKDVHSPPQSLPSKHDSDLVNGSNSVSEADSLVIPGPEDVEDLPFRILRLPCTQMTTTCLLDKPEPLWSAEKATPLLPPESSLLRADNYNYYVHTEQERQSVLSPSLDELSSRDELFSTDVEDVDFVSGALCVEGCRLTDEGSDSYSTPQKGDLENADSEEGCTACQETCSTCGLRLMAPSSELTHREYAELDEYCEQDVLDEGNSDGNLEECEEEWSSAVAHEVPVRNRSSSSWRSVPPSYRSPNYKPKKDYCGENGGMRQEEQDQRYFRGLECCERKTTARADKITGRALRSTPQRTYVEWGEATLASDKDGWGRGGKSKAKPWRPANRNPELAARRGGSSKKIAPPRPRWNEFEDHNDAEFSHCKRGRGSAKKKGTRY